MNTDENQKIWIEKIQENLMLRGRSEITFNNYKSVLTRFFKYYNKDVIIKNLKEEDIINFLKDEYIKPNKCKSTYNLSVAAIRLLYLVCFNVSLNRILLPSCKLVKKIPTILPKDIFYKIFNNEKSLKHQCWLLLAFYSGLRVDEVARVKIEDINSKEHKLKVLGKGNKERFTLLNDLTIKYLRLYYIEYKLTKKTGYLFENCEKDTKYEHLNSKTIINYFYKIKKEYNLDNNISFHSLRHSFATYFLMNGGSLLALQSMLGHKSLNSTTIYLHLAFNFNQLEGIKYV